MPDIGRVREWLRQRGVEVLTFSRPTPTADTAARAVGCRPAEIAKSILFLVGGAPVMVVATGDVKVRSGELKRVLGRSGKVRLPTGEEVQNATGYRPGGVCPFLLPEDLPLLLDESLWKHPEIYPAAGDDHSAVPITPNRLQELTGGCRVSVCAPR